MYLENRKIVLIPTILLIILVSVFPRFYQIGLQSPEPDELLWEARSLETLAKFREGRWSELTAHVRHPGAVPVIIMAAGQALAQKINAYRGVEKSGLHYIDSLEAPRLVTAIFSSLIPLILFLLVHRYAGFIPAIFSALLFSLDPYFLSMSRMAHLDAMLTLFCLLSIYVYLLSLEKQSLKLRLLAGFCWGIALSCKITAVILLPILFASKIIFRRTTDPARPVEKLVCWADVWAVISGLITLCLIYQRLWVVEYEKLGRLKFQSPIFAFIRNLSKQFHEHDLIFLLVWVALALATLIFWWRFKKTNSNLPSSAGHVLTITALLLPVIAYCPFVLNNLIRLFLFAGSLSNETSALIDGVGLWVPPPLGYPEFFLRRLPTPTLLAFLLGLILLPLLSARKTLKGQQTQLWILSLAAIVIWLLPISLPEKKVYRYAIPILPFVYVFIGLSCYALKFLPPARKLSLSKGFTLALTALACLTLGLYYFWILSVPSPNYRLYANSLSGGYRSLLERRIKISPAGHEAALESLVNEHELNQHDLTVGVLGEVVELVNSEMARMHPKLHEHIRFTGALDPATVDYVLLVGEYAELDQRLQHSFKTNQALPAPVFEYVYEGVHLMRIFQAPYLPLETPREVSFESLGHSTGQLARSGELKRNVLNVSIQRHAPGFLYFSPGFRVPFGEYSSTLSVKLLPMQNPEKLAADEILLEMDFADCHRALRLNELKANVFTDVQLNCAVSRRHRLPLRAYWTGKASLLVKSIEVRSNS